MKRIALLIAALTLLAALPACSNEGPFTPAPAATPSPAPAGVTRADILAYFMPGLPQIGAQPSKPYRIGVIAGQTILNAPVRAEFEALRAQYAQSFGVTVDLRVASGAQEQLEAARELAASGVEFLILAAEGDRGGIGALCRQSGIPYITMDCRAGTPGQEGYVCAIERDEYLVGVLTGLSVADTLAEATGSASGNIAEITGAVSDPACILRSSGLRRALAAYPDIRVVCSVTTEEDTAYHAAVNVMKAYRSGELHGIVAIDDAAALETLQATLNYGRDEMAGRIWSAGATRDGLTAVWYGQFAQTVELTAQTGMVALEYALQYLEGNGESIPPVVCSVTRAFSAGSRKRLNAIAALIADMDARGTVTCLDSAGEYALFFPGDRLAQVYPAHYYEYGDIAAYLGEFAPYATEAAVYGAPPSG
jgi:ABC-type sugar transport system substrate-binding protein